MKGVLVQNQACKTLVITESTWKGYPDKKQKDLKSDYETDGNLYILPDWSALAKDTSKYPLDDFGCAKLFTEMNVDRFLYDAKSDGLFEKKDLKHDSSRNTQGLYWRKDINNGILNQYIVQFADEIRHVCNEVLYHPMCPRGAQKAEYDEVVKEIESLRNLLWTRYKIFSNYAKNKLRQCFKDLNKMDDTIHFNDSVKTGSLIPCLNGVYDFVSGDFRSTKPDDYFTLYCPVMYNPQADDPAVHKFIGQITQDNKEIESFLRQIIAIALDLNIPTKTMPQLFGRTTNNGKTTFIRAIKNTFGYYNANRHGPGLCCEVNPSAFERGKFGTDRLTPKLAAVEDSRIVFVSEPDKKLAVNTGLLKGLTSNGDFQHEAKFKAPDSRRVSYSIIWEVNTLIEIDDPTLFTRGTLQIVPFDFHVEKPDNKIEETLSSDEARSTWLNWVIKGHEEYVANGNEFSIPPICEYLQETYQKGQRGAIPTFLDEFFEKDPTGKHYFPCRETFTEFKNWVVLNGYCKQVKMQEQEFKQEAKNFIHIDTCSNLACFIGVRKKQASVEAPSVQFVLDQLFSHEIKATEQEIAAIPVNAVLDVCNRMLKNNGLPGMMWGQFMDELRKRGISVVGDVSNPALEHWRFLTEDEKADQRRRDNEARCQAALTELKNRCKGIKDPKVADIMSELVAKLSVSSEVDETATDMDTVLQILSKLHTLQNAA